MIPVAGLSAGSAPGIHAHSLSRGIIGGTIGLVIGLIAAWLLPRLLWNMLHLFMRKGWFLQPERPESDEGRRLPVLTLDEFIDRSQAAHRQGRRLKIVRTIILVIVGLTELGACRLADHIRSTKPGLLNQYLFVVGYGAFVMGYVLLRSRRMEKQLVRKHGLACPACDSPITGAVCRGSYVDVLKDVSFRLVPFRESSTRKKIWSTCAATAGLCTHCGTQVIET